MNNKKRILFLNPPGVKIYIRDYYCSKVSKAYYLPQPVDLLVQTSYFDSVKYELQVIDSIAEKKSVQQSLDEIFAFQPTHIIGQLGSVSLTEDEAFYMHVKSLLPDVQIACSGDALLDQLKEKLLQYSWLDVIVTNFFMDGTLKWVENNLDDATGICFLKGDQLINEAGKRSKNLALSIPKQGLFTGKYRMPFADAEPIATVLTNYACPYPCTFCIMSTLPYTTRSADSIINEFKYLKTNGYKFIYFSDQTFFQSKSVTKTVLEWMIEAEYGINWMCFSRVDVLNKEELQLMKNAGCKLIMFGVEWADNELLEKYEKHYTVAQIKKTFTLAKELKIQRLGTFLIGVPNQSKASIEHTIKFAKEIDADYASFNVAVPRSNTSFRTEALEQGIINEDTVIMDQSGDQIEHGNGTLTKHQLQNLKNKAYRSFYFRPTYILSRLFKISTFTEFKMHCFEGFYVLKGILKRSSSSE